MCSSLVHDLTKETTDVEGTRHHKQLAYFLKWPRTHPSVLFPKTTGRTHMGACVPRYPRIRTGRPLVYVGDYPEGKVPLLRNDIESPPTEWMSCKLNQWLGKSTKCP